MRQPVPAVRVAAAGAAVAAHLAIVFGTFESAVENQSEAIGAAAAAAAAEVIVVS